MYGTHSPVDEVGGGVNEHSGRVAIVERIDAMEGGCG